MSLKKINVMIFPAGSEIGLEINRSLKYLKDIDVYGCTSVEDASVFSYGNLFQLPFYNTDGFVNDLIDFIEKKSIDVIFPAHDELTVIFTRLKKDNIIPPHVHVICSSYQTSIIARSKKKTYETLSNIIRVPHLYVDKTEITKLLGHNFLFLKPDIGQGSKGARLIKQHTDIPDDIDPFVITEYLPGDEFTVDCFTDRHGKLRYISARKRSKIVNGISSDSDMIFDHAINLIAGKINDVIEFRGMWFFQLKRDRFGEYCLLEIAVRVSGGMGMQRINGINLPLLAIYDFYGVDINFFGNSEKIKRISRLESKYICEYKFDDVYVDLDDTLIINGLVNFELLSLIYSWKQYHNKRVHLITRHECVFNESVDDCLLRCEIMPSLFQSIISLQHEELKSDYIEKERAIFIDDSTRERIDVSSNLSIPTYTSQQVLEVYFAH
ncbi:ATP-grasp domain-containing protein [Aeromonas veronii]